MYELKVAFAKGDASAFDDLLRFHEFAVEWALQGCETTLDREAVLDRAWQSWRDFRVWFDFPVWLLRLSRE